MNKESVNQLEGAIALKAIADQLREDTQPDQPFAQKCFTRLSQALAVHETGEVSDPSELDIAVLVRQVLRFNDGSIQPGAEPTKLIVPSDQRWPSKEEWCQVGVVAREHENGFLVSANPWHPDWLQHIPPQGVDAKSVSEQPVQKTNPITGDPFLKGHESYSSDGQRTAVRAALTMPSGSTLLVSLPTGDGKSFVFQMVGHMGFNSEDGLDGVTLVISPTTALALDHERSAKEMGLGQHGLGYFGDGQDKEEKEEIRKRIRNGTQGLCFTSPESIRGGALNNALVDAASAGHLRLIVIDEAHMVETWGLDFRPDFQLISGVWNQLLTKAPDDRRPRTLLLSATFTETAISTLRILFPGSDPDGSAFRYVIAAQLRPEIEYWVAEDTDLKERERRVKETLLHMPRPIILYVTKRVDAEEWFNKLKDQGFRRLEMMHGDTPRNKREKIIKDWNTGELDLVIGTAAFGLGIDNKNVRTVVHACIPETMDRFYQEVGRGGRDGCPSASIIIPTNYKNRKDDHSTAKRLNGRKVLTPEVAYRRWNAMFYHEEREQEDYTVHRLRLDVRAGKTPKYMDMNSVTSTNWNRSLLGAAANTEMVKLLGPAFENNEVTSRIYQRIDILEPGINNITVWEERLTPYSDKLKKSYKNNLNALKTDHLQARECTADILKRLYEFDLPPSGKMEVQSIRVPTPCLGCPHCRKNGRQRALTPPHLLKSPSWEPRDSLPLVVKKLLGTHNRVVIFYPDPEVLKRPDKRRWIESLGTLLGYGVQNFIVPPSGPIDPKSIQDKHPNVPMFLSRTLPPFDDLPKGPKVVIIPPGDPLNAMHRSRNPFDEHFLFVHNNTKDPDRPEVLLKQRFSGPQYELDQFVRRLS